jgi:hypothetical protein
MSQFSIGLTGPVRAEKTGHDAGLNDEIQLIPVATKGHCFRHPIRMIKTPKRD